MDHNESNWHAWYNVMPGGPPSLHVTGEIEASGTIGSARLVFDSLIKNNPPVLVLRIEEHTIFVPDDEAMIRLHYSDLGGPGRYDSILIVRDGNKVVEIAGEDIQIVT